jgi:hypothetical protein
VSGRCVAASKRARGDGSGILQVNTHYGKLHRPKNKGKHDNNCWHSKRKLGGDTAFVGRAERGSHVIRRNSAPDERDL